MAEVRLGISQASLVTALHPHPLPPASSHAPRSHFNPIRSGSIAALAALALRAPSRYEELLRMERAIPRVGGVKDRQLTSSGHPIRHPGRLAPSLISPARSTQGGLALVFSSFFLFGYGPQLSNWIRQQERRLWRGIRRCRESA